jgi:hypothetical protein
VELRQYRSVLRRHAAAFAGFRLARGAHSISFGASWTRPSSDGDGPFQADGAFTFSGIVTSSTAQATGGLNLADFLMGYPASYRLGGSQINNEYVHAVGTYVNDVWRVSRRITLNYGLRWEPYLAPQDRNGFVTAFVRENFDKGIRSTVYPNAPVGLLFKGDKGFPDNNANSFNQYNQLGPRFGLVWDPAGDSKQTIRTGFGIYYDSPKTLDHGAPYVKRAVRKHRRCHAPGDVLPRAQPGQ